MFKTLFYIPLYNALSFLAAIVPGHNIGLAIVILTILVRICLFPLYQKAAITQFKMKQIEPEIAKIKEQYPDKQKQTEELLKLYQINKINPFASILGLFIQLPIIIALFTVFKGNFTFDHTLIYSFNIVPSSINPVFLGFIDLAARSIVLAILVGVTQFIQMQISIPKIEKKNGKTSMQEDLARNMNLQMKYVMPVFIAFIAMSLSAAVSLYWITGNLFSIAQELYIRKKHKKYGV